MAIFEKTIQNKKFDQLLWKLEVISKRAMPGAASVSLNGTA